MPIVIVQISHDFFPGEYGSITRLFDCHFSEKIDRRHDMREVHRRYRRSRNRRTEKMLRVPRRVDPVRNASMIEQHIQQDRAHR